MLTRITTMALSSVGEHKDTKDQREYQNEDSITRANQAKTYCTMPPLKEVAVPSKLALYDSAFIFERWDNLIIVG